MLYDIERNEQLHLFTQVYMYFMMIISIIVLTSNISLITMMPLLYTIFVEAPLPNRPLFSSQIILEHFL